MLFLDEPQLSLFSSDSSFDAIVLANDNDINYLQILEYLLIGESDRK